MSASKHGQLEELIEARELFMEAEFEEALAKFKEAAEAVSGDNKRWPDALAAQTGQAEVRIQQKDWTNAANLLTAAIAAATASAAAAPDVEGSRDLTRARYMLGIALLGQKKPDAARAEFDAAMLLAEDEKSSQDCRALLPDIQDRLAQIEEDVEEDDLVEIAIEFGVAPEEASDDEEDDEEDEEDEEEEDYDDEDEEEETAAGKGKGNAAQLRAAAAAAAGNPRKRRAGKGDEEEDDDEEEEDFEDEDEDEEEDEEASGDAAGGVVPKKRARPAAAATGRNGTVKSGGGAGDEDDEEEVSSSA